MRNFIRITLATVLLAIPRSLEAIIVARPAVAEPAITQTQQFVKLDTSNPYGLAPVTVKLADFNLNIAQPAVAATQAEAQARQEAAAADVKAVLARNGYNPAFASLYMAAAQHYGIGWQLLAAVHKVESGQSGDRLVVSYAGAQGPMQFMPGTFAAYAVDGDGDGVASINQVSDAVFTAANYLRAGGAASGNAVAALFNYNHSSSYVYHVLAMAQALGYK